MFGPHIPRCLRLASAATFGLAIGCIEAGTATVPDTSSRNGDRAASAPALPAQFEQSDGGWIARGLGYELRLADATAHLSLSDGQGNTGSIRMALVGARPHSPAAPEGRPAAVHNYLLGTDPARWRTSVPVWDKVRFREVLNGVDLVFYGRGPHFEYDLVLAEGADPDEIRIAYEGAESAELSATGDLVLHTKAGAVVQHKPIAYQEEGGRRNRVSASFRLEGGHIAFELGPYDRAKALVIDPQVDFSTVWAFTKIQAIAADSTGSTYIAGSTIERLPATQGAFQRTCGKDGECDTPKINTVTDDKQKPDGYIARFSPDGSTLEYCTYLGGSGSDKVRSIVVDADGNVIVGGDTSSPNFPVTSGAYRTLFSGSAMGFVAKLNATGTGLIWSTLVGGTGVIAVALDGGNNAYFLSNPGYSAVVETPNALPQPTGSYLNPYLGKLDAAGARLMYGSHMPGPKYQNEACALAVDGSGNAWIAGSAKVGDLYFWPCQFNVYQDSDTSDVYVLGVDTNTGNVLLNTSLAGSKMDNASGIGIDGNGNIYIAGSTKSTDFPGIDPEIVQAIVTPFSTEKASFVVKLASDTRARLWTSTDTGPALRMRVDSAGNVALMRQGSLDYLDSSGNRLWSSLGGAGGTFDALDGLALGVDTSGKLYVAPNADPTGNAWQSQPAAKSGAVAYTSGFMKVTPRGGSLVVIPDHLDLTGIAEMQIIIGSTGETAPLPVRYTISTSAKWLRFSNPLTGLTTRLPGGNRFLKSYPMTVTADPDLRLFPGVYDATITVTAPGLPNSPLSIPVHIDSRAGVRITDEVLVQVATGRQWTQVSIPRLPGGKVSTNTAWIRYDPVTGFWINSTALSEGIHEAEVTIEVPGDVTSPHRMKIVVLAGATGNDNAFVVQPGNVTFTRLMRNRTPVTATLGISPVVARYAFSAEAGAPWLQVTPTEGQTPAVLSITADPSALDAGTYVSFVRIVAPQTAIHEVRIPVVMNIIEEGVAVSPPALAFYLPKGAGSQDFTLSLESSEAIPFTTAGIVGCKSFQYSGGAPAGTLPADIALTINPADCGDLSMTHSNPLTVRYGNGAVDIPITILRPPLIPSISPGGIVNGATFQPGPVAPGSIVSLFGTNLAPQALNASTRMLPYELAATRLEGSLSDYARLFYVSANQVNFQLPFLTMLGTQTIGVKTLDAVSERADIQVVPIAPYIFVWGDRRGVVQNSDYSLNTSSNPAPAGSHVIVYLTGQGQVEPKVETGVAAPFEPLSRVKAPVTASVDGQSGEVSFAGLVPGLVGLCQVNVRLPQGLQPGEHKLMLNIGGVDTNPVIISTK